MTLLGISMRQHLWGRKFDKKWWIFHSNHRSCALEQSEDIIMSMSYFRRAASLESHSQKGTRVCFTFHSWFPPTSTRTSGYRETTSLPPSPPQPETQFHGNDLCDNSLALTCTVTVNNLLCVFTPIVFELGGDGTIYLFYNLSTNKNISRRKKLNKGEIRQIWVK